MFSERCIWRLQSRETALWQVLLLGLMHRRSQDLFSPGTGHAKYAFPQASQDKMNILCLFLLLLSEVQCWVSSWSSWRIFYPLTHPSRAVQNTLEGHGLKTFWPGSSIHAHFPSIKKAFWAKVKVLKHPPHAIQAEYEADDNLKKMKWNDLHTVFRLWLLYFLCNDSNPVLVKSLVYCVRKSVL